MSQDPASTAFAQIRRLPPSSFLSASAGEFRIASYWSPPREDAIRFRSQGDYVERFRELLEVSIADRLRAQRVALVANGPT